MRFEVKTEHKGGLSTDHVFNDWNDCRNFLLVLTDNNGILIRDIAESLLQIGVYEHSNKWYTLRVTCEHDITIGEAAKVLSEYRCSFTDKCDECPLHASAGCLSLELSVVVDRLSRRNEKA